MPKQEKNTKPQEKVVIAYVYWSLRAKPCASLLCQLISIILTYLIWCGELFAIGSEGDKASGQVSQTANLQVGARSAGRRRGNCVCYTHHVAVTPLNTAAKQPQHELSINKYKWMQKCTGQHRQLGGCQTGSTINFHLVNTHWSFASFIFVTHRGHLPHLPPWMLNKDENQLWKDESNFWVWSVSHKIIVSMFAILINT